MRVLIVEDDFISRKLLHRMLGHYGECDIAVSGEEAITAFKLSVESKQEYDLICMDIMMPGMDGQQALQEIRNIEKNMGRTDVDGVKVMMITALDDPKNVVQSLHKGAAVAYITKPIDKANLMAEIRKLGILS